MSWVAPVITTVATVASLVGTGVAIYSASQQARSQRSIAQANYLTSQREADLQQQAAQLAFQPRIAAVDIQKTAIDLESTGLEAQRLQQQQQIAANIASLETERQTRERETVEQLQRVRQEKERNIARRRAAYASAGILIEGTPLEVLADTASLFELVAADELYKARIERIGIEEEIRFQRKSGQNIDINANIAKQMNEVRKTLTGLDAYSASADLRIANMQAELTRRGAEIDLQSGLSRARGTRYESFASGVSGISNFASQASTATQQWGNYFGNRS